MSHSLGAPEVSEVETSVTVDIDAEVLVADGSSVAASVSVPSPAVVAVDDAPQDVKDGIVDIYAVVDDTMVPHPEWQECRTDNNVGEADGKCLMPG